MQYWHEICLYLLLQHIICSIRCIYGFYFRELDLYEMVELWSTEVELSERTNVPYIKKIPNRRYLPRERCSHLLSKCFSDIDTGDIMLTEYSFF